MSSNVFSLTNSVASGFIHNLILVPLPKVFPLGSLATVKLPVASDVHIYCSSSLCLDVTSTLSATRYDD